MRRTFRRAGAIGVVISVIGLAGTALATGNSVSVKPPSTVKANTLYSITISGHAKKKERLYLFVDYLSCGANPNIEHFTHGAPGDYWYVKGDFSKVSSGWHSGKTGQDHVCAYLQKKSQPVNGAGGVKATSFKTYLIN
jgi:hypothetical protein